VGRGQRRQRRHLPPSPPAVDVRLGAVLEAGTEAMRPFLAEGGRVELPIRGHLVTGVRPG
jgi:hypothetical protein